MDVDGARTDDGLALCELAEHDLQQLSDELVAYHGLFADLFWRREQTDWALQYLQGLMIPGISKSAETIALHLEGGNVRNLQQFIGQGAWDHRPILERHAELVAQSLGEPDGVLIVDDSAFPKKGNHSVGVMRQYCGATGKVDNCQVGVFVGYAASGGYTLLDCRLYMPEPWFEEPYRERRARCLVPDELVFRTKPELAWEMIQGLVSRGKLPFSWITCDEGYGQNVPFLKQLEAAGLRYLATVPVSTRVWQQRPLTAVPPTGGKGRAPSHARPVPGSPAPVRADALAAELAPELWRQYEMKAGEKGPIMARCAFVRVVAVRDGLPGPDGWLIFMRTANDPDELRVFVSNAPADTPADELVRVLASRWPIETCFEEAKGCLGMDQYQTRSWRGWHHHMTLVLLAHHFLVRVKLTRKGGQWG